MHCHSCAEKSKPPWQSEYGIFRSIDVSMPLVSGQEIPEKICVDLLEGQVARIRIWNLIASQNITHIYSHHNKRR